MRNNKYTNPWKEEEVDFLKDNYKSMRNKDLAKQLHKTLSSIGNKLNILHLVRPSEVLLNWRREIIEKYHKGKPLSINSRKLMSDIKKKQYAEGTWSPWCKGGKNPYTTKRNLENNPMDNIETRKKSRDSNLKNGTYQRMSIRMKENNPTKNGLSKEWKDNIGLASKKHWLDKDYRKMMTNGFKGENNPSKRLDVRLKHKISAKKQWANKNSRDKLLNSLCKRPTKPEKIMMEIIKEYSFPFNYVGDGKIWFNGGDVGCFNPDFLSKNPKHIIEVYGDYWHNLPKNKKKDGERIATYSKYGYKTLVIWEHELKDISIVVSKIKSFMEE